MNQWNRLEKLITQDGTQRVYDAVKEQILIAAVKKGVSLTEDIIEELGWMDECYQVVCSRSLIKDQTKNYFRLGELIFLGACEKDFSFEFTEKAGTVLVLRGRMALDRLESLRVHYITRPPQKNSPLYNLFLTCGQEVHSLAGLQKSYQSAVSMMERRFFAKRDQHMLTFASEYVKKSDEKKPLGEEEMERFCRGILGSIQAFNKSFLHRQLELLYNYLVDSHQDEQSVRLFLAELFMRVREKLKEKYPLLKNTNFDGTMLREVLSQEYLYEFIDIMFLKLDTLMHNLGAPSRETVLKDIQFYIENNIGDDLKLATIAPLFGYNSAYLGKIFRQNMGKSFNTYVDEARIDSAKELLERGELKVYEIAERVGYKNVDYFHKKFQKNVGMSPAAYRKTAAKDKMNKE